MDNRYFIEALGRGLQVLEAFSEEDHSLTLTEISDAVALNKSTTFRFVYTLENLGYLERDPETKRYRPGLKVLRLGFVALNSLELAQIARPFLKALSKRCGETTNMTVRDGDQIVYVARNKTQQVISVNLQLGSRLPVHCTSMGKALLVDFSREELRQLLGEGPYPVMGPNTITTLNGLAAELEQVRRRGYAINDEELTAGLRSVAAPVRARQSQVVAAINISIPSARASRQEMEQSLAAMALETASEISLALGAKL